MRRVLARLFNTSRNLLARPTSRRTRRPSLNLEVLEGRLVPSANALLDHAVTADGRPAQALTAAVVSDLGGDAFGELGRVAYPVAAGVMELRHIFKAHEALTDQEKDVFGRYFGDLVERVRVTYGADSIGEWG